MHRILSSALMKSYLVTPLHGEGGSELDHSRFSVGLEPSRLSLFVTDPGRRNHNREEVVDSASVSSSDRSNACYITQNAPEGVGVLLPR